MALKIFRVEISNEYYCLAEDEREAEEFADDARDDFYDWDVHAHEVRDPKYIPRDWLDGYVYHNGSEDINLKDWIAARAAEEAERKKKEELEALQGKLF